MPLFNAPLPTPTVFAPDTLGVTMSAGAVAITAGASFLQSAILYAPVTVTQMRTVLTGTPTGNVDMGIYDASAANGLPGNLLGHTGAIAAVTGLFSQNLTANLALSPGRYWVALMDTVADSIIIKGNAGGGSGPCLRSNATNLTVLPASAGTMIDTNLFVLTFGILQNGWT
jgi:hypothetical protein